MPHHEMPSLRTALDLLRTAAANPIRTARYLGRVPAAIRADELCASMPRPDERPRQPEPDNPLRSYFDAHREGPGIWKWTHYFDIYHRHFQRFVGTDVHVVEIGVYSGGSLQMWRDYFGPECRITGVDIAEECRAYESDRTRIAIGDQADRDFWASFRAASPRVDILIDDGGHTPEQQMVTVEEMLPHLAPGGVYVCEDIHGRGSHFAAFMQMAADALNAAVRPARAPEEGVPVYVPTGFQAAVRSISFYPFAVVIEKNAHEVKTLTAPKHGTEWQSFFDHVRD